MAANSNAKHTSVHTVDWCVLQEIHQEVVQACDEGIGEPLATPQLLFDCWYQVLCRRSHSDREPLTEADKAFLMTRVVQSVRELDFQTTGQVGLSLWCHHMFLTRGSPHAMKFLAMLTELVEAAIIVCPGILVSLLHALEVACISAGLSKDADTVDTEEGSEVVEVPTEHCDHTPQGALDTATDTEGDTTDEAILTTPLPIKQLVQICVGKTWPLRPCNLFASSKRRLGHNITTMDELVDGVVRALEMPEDTLVAPRDFLAICLGRRVWPVTLHLYDLSHGVASVLAPLLLNERIEGVWHTGVVIYGREYFFGGEIYYDVAGQTGFGVPRQSRSLGHTLRSREEFHTFIVDDLKPLFTREAYDAANNNCNHFTDRASLWLVGKHIPEEVLVQPELLVRSGVGRALRPVMTKLLGQYFNPKRTSADVALESSALHLAGLAIRPDGSEVANPNAQEPWGLTIPL